MNELKEIIARINGEVYQYHYQEAMNLIPNLISEIERWQEVQKKSAHVIADFNDILGFINQAIIDNDFLRMADILQYELLTAVEAIESPKEELQ